MSYQNLVQQAKQLGIFYVGETSDKLEQRINDKLNGTGIYADSIIDPDTRIDELMKIAFDFNIKTHSPALAQNELVEKINKKLKEGYEIGKRYHSEPYPPELTDSELNKYYIKLYEKQQDDPSDKDVYYKLQSCRGEFITRKIELPKVK